MCSARHGTDVSPPPVLEQASAPSGTESQLTLPEVLPSAAAVAATEVVKSPASIVPEVHASSSSGAVSLHDHVSVF